MTTEVRTHCPDCNTRLVEDEICGCMPGPTVLLCPACGWPVYSDDEEE